MYEYALRVRFPSPGMFDVVVSSNAQTQDVTISFIKHVVTDTTKTKGRSLLGAEFPCWGWPKDFANPDQSESGYGPKGSTLDKEGNLVTGLDYLGPAEFQIGTASHGWFAPYGVDVSTPAPPIAFKNFHMKQWNALEFLALVQGKLVFPVRSVTQLYNDPPTVSKVWAKKILPVIGNWGCGFALETSVTLDAVRHKIKGKKVGGFEIRGGSGVRRDEQGTEFVVMDVTSEYKAIDWQSAEANFPSPIYDLKTASLYQFGIPALWKPVASSADSYAVLRCGTKLNYLTGFDVSPQPGNFSQALYAVADVDFTIHATN